MADSTDYVETYRQHLREMKENAFARFVASGYRDAAAWQRFLDAFETLRASADEHLPHVNHSSDRRLHSV